MSNVKFAAVLSSLAVGFIACAKTPAVETGAAPASNVSTASGDAVSWSGNITAVTESNSDLRQSSRGNGYGNVQLTPGDSRSSTRVNITYSSGGTSDRNLNWAVLPGRCGAGSLPILPISNFPELAVGGDGRAQVNVVLPFDFPARGDYHLNIYHERQQTLDQVVACGNLRPSKG